MDRKRREDIRCASILQIVFFVAGWTDAVTSRSKAPRWISYTHSVVVSIFTNFMRRLPVFCLLMNITWNSTMKKIVLNRTNRISYLLILRSRILDRRVNVCWLEVSISDKLPFNTGSSFNISFFVRLRHFNWSFRRSLRSCVRSSRCQKSIRVHLR